MGAAFHDPIRPGVVPGQQKTESEMSDTNEATKRPTHIVYQVIEGAKDGDKAKWLRIGAAWAHGDIRGANIVLNSFPRTGRIVMRERTDEQPENGGQQ